MQSMRGLWSLCQREGGLFRQYGAELAITQGGFFKHALICHLLSALSSLVHT